MNKQSNIHVCFIQCLEILQRRKLPLFLKTCSAFDCHAAVYGSAVSYKCSLSIRKENTQFCNGVENPVFIKHLSVYTVCFSGNSL